MRYLWTAFSREEADLAFALRSDEARQRRSFGKARLAQHALPLRAAEQRMHGAQVAVGEAPPAAREAEDGFGPELRRGHIHEDERASGREQVVQIVFLFSFINRVTDALGFEHYSDDQRIRGAAFLRKNGYRLPGPLLR